MTLKKTITAVIRRNELFYVAECVEIGVVTQGESLDETTANLREAVDLFLEGEDASEFGLIDNPTIIVSYELDAAYA